MLKRLAWPCRLPACPLLHPRLHPWCTAAVCPHLRTERRVPPERKSMASANATVASSTAGLTGGGSIENNSMTSADQANGFTMQLLTTPRSARRQVPETSHTFRTCVCCLCACAHPMCLCARPHLQTQTRAHTHTHMRARMHARAHARTHTHTHTHLRTDACAHA